MGNPAAELYDIFTEWRTADGTSNFKRRGMSDEAGRAQVQRAMALLGQVKAEIDALDAAGRRVSSYKEAYTEWLFAILAVSTGWRGQSAAESDFSDTGTNALDTLADMLDHLPGSRLDRTAVGVLHARLEAVLTAVDEDDSLDDRLKRHIRQAVRNVQTCVDEFETTGESATMAALDALWAATIAASAKSKYRKRWEDLSEKFFLPTASGLVASAPGVIAMLMQGG